MAVFIKPNRWTRQPPYNAGVDWNNPLTAGIRNLWNMSQRGMVDAVGNANGTPIGGVGLAGRNDGLASTFDSSGTTYVNLPRPTQFNLASGSRWTLLFRIATTSDTGQALWHYGDGTTTNRCAIFVGDGVTGSLTNELITWSRASAFTAAPTMAFTTTTRSLLLDGAWHTVMVTSNGSACAIWLDGISRTVTVGAGSNNGLITVPGATTATLGAQNIGTIAAKFNGSMSLGAFWARDMSQFAQELHQRPWQLFRPANQVFYSLASGVYSLDLDAGSYALTGRDVGTTSARNIGLDAGSYTLTGRAVDFSFGRQLVLDAGSYSLTGRDVGLTSARSLGLDAGSYALTGRDVTLTYLAPGNFTLALDSGAYNLTGRDVNFGVTLSMLLDSGAYSLTGRNVGLTWSGEPPVEITDRIVTLRSLTERWRM